MGLAREPAILEYAAIGNEQIRFDFTKPDALQGELKTILTVKNPGKRPLDAINFELIGQGGQTPFASSDYGHIQVCW